MSGRLQHVSYMLMGYGVKRYGFKRRLTTKIKSVFLLSLHLGAVH